MLNRGTVTAKKNLGDNVRKGDEGIIVSWHPNKDKYVFYFANGELVGFEDITLVDLEKSVEINLDST